MSYTAGQYTRLQRYQSISKSASSRELNEASSLKVLVEKVRQRKEEFPDLIQSIMASINEICVQFEKLWFALSQTSESTLFS
jgi:mevalonate kinase